MYNTRIIRLYEPVSNPELKCVHALTGEAPAGKGCANWFDCKTCEYEQMLEDTAGLDGCHWEAENKLAMVS
jgi:hypothetical protein